MTAMEASLTHDQLMIKEEVGGGGASDEQSEMDALFGELYSASELSHSSIDDGAGAGGVFDGLEPLLDASKQNRPTTTATASSLCDTLLPTLSVADVSGVFGASGAESFFVDATQCDAARLAGVKAPQPPAALAPMCTDTTVVVGGAAAAAAPPRIVTLPPLLEHSTDDHHDNDDDENEYENDDNESSDTGTESPQAKRRASQTTPSPQSRPRRMTRTKRTRSTRQRASPALAPPLQVASLSRRHASIALLITLHTHIHVGVTRCQWLSSKTLQTSAHGRRRVRRVCRRSNRENRSFRSNFDRRTFHTHLSLQLL
jgi:hypothetical protein